MELQKVTHYFTDCKAFKLAATSRLTTSVQFQDPPQLATVPLFRWLMTVYCHDVLQRLDEVKATITSTFGYVLKMGSTKKVAKKLSGLSQKKVAEQHSDAWQLGGTQYLTEGKALKLAAT